MLHTDTMNNSELDDNEDREQSGDTDSLKLSESEQQAKLDAALKKHMETTSLITRLENEAKEKKEELRKSIKDVEVDIDEIKVQNLKNQGKVRQIIMQSETDKKLAELRSTELLKQQETKAAIATADAEKQIQEDLVKLEENLKKKENTELVRNITTDIKRLYQDEDFKIKIEFAVTDLRQAKQYISNRTPYSIGAIYRFARKLNIKAAEIVQSMEIDIPMKIGFVFVHYMKMKLSKRTQDSETKNVVNIVAFIDQALSKIRDQGLKTTDDIPIRRMIQSLVQLAIIINEPNILALIRPRPLKRHVEKGVVMEGSSWTTKLGDPDFVNEATERLTQYFKSINKYPPMLKCSIGFELSSAQEVVNFLFSPTTGPTYQNFIVLFNTGLGKSIALLVMLRNYFLAGSRDFIVGGPNDKIVANVANEFNLWGPKLGCPSELLDYVTFLDFRRKGEDKNTSVNVTNKDTGLTKSYKIYGWNTPTVQQKFANRNTRVAIDEAHNMFELGAELAAEYHGFKSAAYDFGMMLATKPQDVVMLLTATPSTGTPIAKPGHYGEASEYLLNIVTKGNKKLDRHGALLYVMAPHSEAFAKLVPSLPNVPSTETNTLVTISNVDNVQTLPAKIHKYQLPLKWDEYYNNPKKCIVPMWSAFSNVPSHQESYLQAVLTNPQEISPKAYKCAQDVVNTYKANTQFPERQLVFMPAIAVNSFKKLLMKVAQQEGVQFDDEQIGSFSGKGKEKEDKTAFNKFQSQFNKAMFTTGEYELKYVYVNEKKAIVHVSKDAIEIGKILVQDKNILSKLKGTSKTTLKIKNEMQFGELFNAEFDGVKVLLQNLHNTKMHTIIIPTTMKEGISFFDLNKTRLLEVPTAKDYIQIIGRGIRYCRSRAIVDKRKMEVIIYILTDEKYKECEMDKYEELQTDLKNLRGENSIMENLRELAVDYQLFDFLHVEAMDMADGSALDFLQKIDYDAGETQKVFYSYHFGDREFQQIMKWFDKFSQEMCHKQRQLAVNDFCKSKDACVTTPFYCSFDKNKNCDLRAYGSPCDYILDDIAMFNKWVRKLNPVLLDQVTNSELLQGVLHDFKTEFVTVSKRKIPVLRRKEPSDEMTKRIEEYIKYIQSMEFIGKSSESHVRLLAVAFLLATFITSQSHCSTYDWLPKFTAQTAEQLFSLGRISADIENEKATWRAKLLNAVQFMTRQELDELTCNYDSPNSLSNFLNKDIDTGFVWATSPLHLLAPVLVLILMTYLNVKKLKGSRKNAIVPDAAKEKPASEKDLKTPTNSESSTPKETRLAPPPTPLPLRKSKKEAEKIKLTGDSDAKIDLDLINSVVQGPR